MSSMNHAACSMEKTSFVPEPTTLTTYYLLLSTEGR